ncbi:hypothetical protein BdWA1_000812 [Babesia duncani]|uniref:Uncharacterized protein n=1 Tax=Babesia duncani TaxID=323732 RepID=A0AAD9PN38_9APIC|nr:hypothetical protein BdWA1_000812 [Babesia duncani]
MENTTQSTSYGVVDPQSHEEEANDGNGSRLCDGNLEHAAPAANCTQEDFNGPYESNIDSDNINSAEKGWLRGLGVTCNIATVSLNTWGSARLGMSFLDDLAKPRKYIADVIRTYKTGCNTHAKETPSSVPDGQVPHVGESDFAEYFRQVAPAFEPHKSESGSVTLRLEHREESRVPRIYFSESYLIQDNEVFNVGFDGIPDSIAVLETYLITVNSELRELLQSRYSYVNESFTHIDELCLLYSHFNNQLDQFRNDFEQVHALSPASPRILSSKERDSSDFSERLTLVDVIVSRRKLMEILLKLQKLRAVAATPEYIQSIAQTNSVELVSIFYTCALAYFNMKLSNFTMTHAIANIITDTMLTLGSVAEAKFVDLALSHLFQILQQSIGPDITALEALVDTLEPLLVVLLQGAWMNKAMDSLAQSCNSMHYQNELDIYKEGFLSVLEVLHIYMALLIRRITCVTLLHFDSKFSKSSHESIAIVEQVLLAIQGRILSSATSPSQHYNRTSGITLGLDGLISVPHACKLHLDYNKLLLRSSGFMNIENVPQDAKYNFDLLECIKIAPAIIWDLGKRSLERLYLNIHFTSVYSNLESILGNYVTTRLLLLECIDGMASKQRLGNCMQNFFLQFENSSDKHSSHFKPGEWLEQSLEQNQSLRLEMEQAMLQVARRFINELHAESCMELHNRLASATWEPGNDSNLLDEMMQIVSHYKRIGTSIPQVAHLVLLKAVDVFGHAFTLMDGQISTLNDVKMDAALGAICARAMFLQAATLQLPTLVQEMHSLVSDHLDPDQLSSITASAEARVSEGTRLVEQCLGMASQCIILHAQPHITTWLEQRGDGSYDLMIPFLDSIRISFELVNPCLNDEMLQRTFSNAFQGLLKFLKPQHKELHLAKLLDDATRLVTELNMPTIRLELCHFSNALTSELNF